MRNLNLLGLYAVLLLATGFMYREPVLLPFALVSALSACAVSYLLVKRDSAGLSVAMLAVSGIVIYLFLGADTALNVVEFGLAGYLIAVLSRFPFNRLFTAITIFLFLITCFEDLTFGMPQVQALSSMMNLRWGLYFLSSSILSAMMFGAVFLASKEDFGFQRVDFGILPVLAFIIGGMCMLIKPFRILGENVVIGAFGFFLVQGLSVAVYLLKDVNIWIKFLTFTFIIVLPAFALAGLGLIGMFDYWFDFRRLRGGAE